MKIETYGDSKKIGAKCPQWTCHKNRPYAAMSERSLNQISNGEPPSNKYIIATVLILYGLQYKRCQRFLTMQWLHVENIPIHPALWTAGSREMIFLCHISYSSTDLQDMHHEWQWWCWQAPSDQSSGRLWCFCKGLCCCKNNNALKWNTRFTSLACTEIEL